MTNFRDSYIAELLYEAGIVDQREAEKIARADRRISQRRSVVDALAEYRTVNRIRGRRG